LSDWLAAFAASPILKEGRSTQGGELFGLARCGRQLAYP
jgi:hypothetical protein